MRHMLGNLSPNYFERTKRYMMLRASQQGTDLTVTGTPPLSLPNSLGKPLKAWSVDVLPYQEGTGDPSPDNVRAIHGTDKVTVWTAGKNLLSNSNASPVTQNGVTFTPNSDGTVTANGTASGNATYHFLSNNNIDFPNGTYVLSGCPEGGGNSTFRLRTDTSNGGSRGQDTGSGVTFTVDDGKLYSTYITVWSGATVNNLVFRPQICLASAPNPTEFTPYVAPSQTVLTLPQTVYTGTIGSEGGESRWDEVDLGTLDWGASTPESHIFRTNSLQSIIKPPTGLEVTDALCEEYAPMAYTPMGPGDNGKFSVAQVGNNVEGRLVIVDHRFNTQSDFETAVTGVKLVYPLINPTQFAVTAPTIPTPTGTATTWATAEDGTVDSMEVTYVGKA